MDEIELLLLYALLVLLSTAAGMARESLLALRVARQAGAEGAGGGRKPPALLARSDEYLLTLLVATQLVKLASVFVLFMVLRPVVARDELRVLAALVADWAVILLVAELVPRHAARVHPDRWVRRLAPFVRALHVVFYPAAWVAGRAARLLRRAFGLEGSMFPAPQTDGTLMELIEASGEDGKLQTGDRELITSIFEFRDTIVREVMVPRVDMVCLEDEVTLVEAHRLIVEKGHSRVPVYHESLDNVVGVFYAKDLLAFMAQGPLGDRLVREALHEPMFVPETKRVAELLREFQQKRLHIAVVVDEYGGTAGLVTIEDLLEEIVGEIRDEFDVEAALHEPDGRGGFIVDAKMPISQIEDELGFVLPEDEEYDTLGGFLFTRLGKVPKAGDVLNENGVEITVLKADERRIHKVRLRPIEAGPAPPDEHRA